MGGGYNPLPKPPDHATGCLFKIYLNDIINSKFPFLTYDNSSVVLSKLYNIVY